MKCHTRYRTAGRRQSYTPVQTLIACNPKDKHEEYDMTYELREGNLQVALTQDTFEYNDTYFTLEVTELADGEGVENEAFVSGLTVAADVGERATYLTAALACAKLKAGPELNIRNVAAHAAQAGLSAVTVRALQGESRAERAAGLVLNVPEFFADESFVAWLNNGSPKFTLHKAGAPSEWSDVIVLVDPSLTGEGSDSDMPEHLWNIVMAACRAYCTPADLALRNHITVRLTNLAV